MKPSADVVALDEARQKRSDHAEADLATAGGMLRAAREALGLSLRDIADRTNIRVDIVEAIEVMDIPKLPSQAYTMGFVRAFAREVDLPEDALMDRFREQAGFTKLVDAPQVKPSLRTNDSMESGRELSVLALIAVLAFILWCAWSLLVRTDPDVDPQATRFDAPPKPAIVDDGQGGEAPLPTNDAIPLEAQEVPASVTMEAGDTAAVTNVEAETALPEPATEVAPGLTAENSDLAGTEAPGQTQQDAVPTPAAAPSEPAAATQDVVSLRRVESIDPVYPPLCESDAADRETVRLRYSVNRSGLPVSPSVISSSNPCFNGAAVTALVRWRYDARSVTPENSRGLTTTFTFVRPF